MTTHLSTEHNAYREGLDRFLQERANLAHIQQVTITDDGYDAAVWQDLCAQFSVSGLHLPTEHDGQGYGLMEAGITAEVMGRYLYSGPYFSSSVLAGYVASECLKGLHQSKVLREIARGKTLYAVALDNITDPKGIGKTINAKSLNSTGGNITVSGNARYVIGAGSADKLLVFATDTQSHANSAPQMQICCVSADQAEVSITPHASMDHTRKLWSVNFNIAKGENLGSVNLADLTRWWDKACVILAHEMIGGSQALLDETVEYMKVRYQFGRPIGSFQALKHRCADLLVELELARSAVYAATEDLLNGESEPASVPAAKAMASETYLKTAQAAIQLHGGMGFTWENGTHFWFKRAKGSQVLFGLPHLNWERSLERTLSHSTNSTQAQQQ